MSTEITLVCWACGKQAEIVVNQPPEFAFQVSGWATDIGWHGALDLDHARALVFCSPEHAKSQLTKKGGFRSRPKLLEPQA